MDLQLKSEKMVQIIAAFLLVVLFAGIYAVYPESCRNIWNLMTSGSMEETIAYIERFGVWAMAVSFLADVLINAMSVLPSIFISTANGVLFGVIPGVLLSWLAETVGVVISFFLMRTLLRESAENLIRKSPYLKKMDDFSGEKGFQMMLIARTIPYFPSGILTALGAVSKISARDYVLANLLGKFPSTALEVIIGHDIVRFEENMMRLTVVVVFATAVYGGLWYWHRKKSEKRAKGK